MAEDSPPRREASSRRALLVEALDLAGREISSATVMFHAALAARRGLSATEEKALDILLRRGPLTHADLVRETGLKPPSVTDLVDRLERRGFVARAAHPSDGRRVIIAADERRITADVTPLFAPWVRELHDLYESFTDDELEAIRRFLASAAERQQAAACALLRQESTESGPS